MDKRSGDISPKYMNGQYLLMKRLLSLLWKCKLNINNIVMEMQIKTTMRYYFISSRMAVIKMTLKS